MGKNDKLIRLLLVQESADAEELVTVLRDGGFRVRAQTADSPREFAEQMAGQVDLVLACAESGVPLSTIAEASAGRDIPFVAMYGSITNETLLKAQRDGVSAVCLREAEHLRQAVQRELQFFAARRSVAKLQKSLEEYERRAEALLESSRDPICFVHEGMHVHANRAYLDMFGFSSLDEIEGMPILDMIAGSHADAFKLLLRRLSKGEKAPALVESKARRGDGGEFDVVMEFAAAAFEGEPCQQITFRIQHAGASAGGDAELVTGLHTRARLLRALEETAAAAKLGRDDLALVLVEPDDWMRVIDTIGLGSADALLGDMANVMREFAQAGDELGRLSDTAFALLVKGAKHENAIERAQALRARFADHLFELPGKSLSLTVSASVVTIGPRLAELDAILGQAASTLKAAHTSGGNRVEVFDAAAHDKAAAEADRQRLAEIRHALEHDGFMLFHQSIVGLHGDEDGEFCEILLRMRAPDGSEIPPSGFFPIAERNNLLPAIDRWVIESALQSLAERERAGQRTTFFIKVAPQTLEDASLLGWIGERLAHHGVRGDALVFELPESRALSHIKPVRQFVEGLKALGCKFALEQFGSGRNDAFQILKHVDADFLKLDRGYMVGLPAHRDNQQKVRELCNEAHRMGKQTIAEFVEDAASMSILFTCRVNFVQGNFAQEPAKVMRA